MGMVPPMGGMGAGVPPMGGMGMNPYGGNPYSGHPAPGGVGGMVANPNYGPMY